MQLSFHRRETKGPGEPEARSSDSRLVLGPQQLGKVEDLVVGVMGKHRRYFGGGMTWLGLSGPFDLVF